MNVTILEDNIETFFDRNKFKRILLNLLSNAVKYNNENGEISVVLDKIILKNEVNLRISISDTGIGINDSNKEKIFDRFYQENHDDKTYVGSGIGLHIVKEYITMHDGEIRVIDNKPCGSIFIITIPVVQELKNNTDINRELTHNDSPAQQQNNIVKEESKPVEKQSILVVEDNDDFRMFISNCLKDKYEIHCAADGLLALDVLAHNKIDLVISDVMMPNMDGVQLCQKIKGNIRYSHIPVILLTAKTADEHILTGLKEGADDYIAKPFNLDILLLRIEKIMRWTNNNHKQFAQKIDISPSDITVSKLDEQLIEKAIRTLEENIDNSDFSVEDLSAAVGMSRGHLYKKLTSITGKSPIEFIRIIRLKRGKQMLEQSQMSISEIAYQVGLSPKQFAKYFKEEYGEIPSKWQKENQSSNIEIPENLL